MGENTKIEWCDATWNPVRGCSKVSEGCRNCYAMGVAARFNAPGQPYDGLAKRTPEGPQWTNVVRPIPSKLAEPLHWREPRRIFVNSMSDLFHPAVGFDFIDQIFAVMAACPQHTFQILTKRPEVMRQYLTRGSMWLESRRGEIDLAMTNMIADQFVKRAFDHHEFCFDWPLPNVWIGVSAEDQGALDKRAPELLACPAAVRFLSCEPMIGPLDPLNVRVPDRPLLRHDILRGYTHCGPGRHEDTAKIDWVIVGGESGPQARPMHPKWARDLRDECIEAGVAFHFKQWGCWSPVDEPGELFSHAVIPRPESANNVVEWATVASTAPKRAWRDLAVAYDDAGVACATLRRTDKRAAGRLLDGRTWDEFPRGTAE